MKHRGEPANDVAELDGQYHVGRYFPDMFPAIENQCPCPKAPCGLVVPVADVPCEQHHGSETLRQIHHVDECGKKKTRTWAIDLKKRMKGLVNQP